MILKIIMLTLLGYLLIQGAAMLEYAVIHEKRKSLLSIIIDGTTMGETGIGTMFAFGLMLFFMPAYVMLDAIDDICEKRKRKKN